MYIGLDGLLGLHVTADIVDAIGVFVNWRDYASWVYV
jgi:hypothetical protein